MHVGGGADGFDFWSFTIGWCGHVRPGRLFLPPVAVASCDGQRAGQSQEDHGTTRPGEVADGCTHKKSSTRYREAGASTSLGSSPRKFTQVDSYVRERPSV
jgi:hypothetical protein